MVNYFKGYIYYTQIVLHNPKNNQKIINSNLKIVISSHSSIIFWAVCKRVGVQQVFLLF